MLSAHFEILYVVLKYCINIYVKYDYCPYYFIHKSITPPPPPPLEMPSVRSCVYKAKSVIVVDRETYNYNTVISSLCSQHVELLSNITLLIPTHLNILSLQYNRIEQCYASVIAHNNNIKQYSMLSLSRCSNAVQYC